MRAIAAPRCSRTSPGVERRAEPWTGNISIYRFRPDRQGWIWLIPLTDDITSIGAVLLPETPEAARLARSSRS